MCNPVVLLAVHIAICCVRTGQVAVLWIHCPLHCWDLLITRVRLQVKGSLCCYQVASISRTALFCNTFSPNVVVGGVLSTAVIVSQFSGHGEFMFLHIHDYKTQNVDDDQA